jgi:LuxR family maltose regulon positive regulatory protein
MTAQGGPASALTTAELRILQYLPSHLTLAQIGEHLFVSASTVKTHVLSIYRKFGVGSRAEAVARARTLGLVESPITD